MKRWTFDVCSLVRRWMLTYPRRYVTCAVLLACQQLRHSDGAKLCRYTLCSGVARYFGARGR
jgi:hypothetical protein